MGLMTQKAVEESEAQYEFSDDRLNKSLAIATKEQDESQESVSSVASANEKAMDEAYWEQEAKGISNPFEIIMPVASDIVDFDNAVGSAVAGDWEDAVWSAAAAIPLVGTPIVKALKPKKTVKAYKLFRTDPNKPGELFPLFVNAKQSVKQGEWVDAEIGPSSGKKVKSKIGDLAMRPGWHSGDLPVATHIGGKTSKGLSAPDYRPDNQVWAEVEMPDDVDWQSIATSRADKKKNGDIIARTAHITDQLPTGGHYRYKTNSNMTGNWIIGGSMKVNKVLSDVDVKKINDAAGVSDLPRIVNEIPKFNQGGLVDNEMETRSFFGGGYSGESPKTMAQDNGIESVVLGKDETLKAAALRTGIPLDSLLKYNMQGEGLKKEKALTVAMSKEDLYSKMTPKQKAYFGALETKKSAGTQVIEKASEVVSDVKEAFTPKDTGEKGFVEKVGDKLSDVYYSLTADTSTYDDEMRDLNLVEKAEVQVEPETEVKVQTDKILSGDTVGIELTGWSNLAGSESTTLHVDPANIITMGWGVVPDGGVKVNGKLVKPKDFAAHKLTSESNLDKVDTSGAYKRVNGVTYKRSDYTSDEYFSKAIYSGFYASAKSKVKNFDKLTDAGKEVVVDFGYNGGELFFKFNDTATLVTELIKPEAERNLKELTKFTQNFSMQGVGNTIGVLRRRAVMANKILGSKDQIAYIEQTKLANKNTIFSMKRADGTEVNKWLKLEKHTVDSPAGMPIVNIEGERMSKYIAPKSASVDLTNWSETIT